MQMSTLHVLQQSIEPSTDEGRLLCKQDAVGNPKKNENPMDNCREFGGCCCCCALRCRFRYCQHTN